MTNLGPQDTVTKVANIPLNREDIQWISRWGYKHNTNWALQYFCEVFSLSSHSEGATEASMQWLSYGHPLN